jgi:pimeloyl-ACP methyl ester carboxylesterase
MKSNMPNIVLVHGAWADASGWQKVILHLDHAGYPVIAVQNPLSSLADDVANTKRVIDAQTGPTIVVAHSYGGAVMTGAAAGNLNVKALVYIAAFAPDSGEPFSKLLSQYPNKLSTAFVPDSAGFLYLNRSMFHDLFCRDVDSKTALVMAATQKPISSGIFEQSPENVAWKNIPSWFIVATEDQVINPDLERFFAKRMNARTTEIKSSHVAFISHSDEVFKMIEAAAKATVMGPVSVK